MRLKKTRIIVQVLWLAAVLSALTVATLAGCTAAGAWDMLRQLDGALDPVDGGGDSTDDPSSDPPAGGDPDPPTVPFDPGAFLYAHELVFDNSGQTETLDEFPVLVTLTSTRVDYSAINGDGSDLRFADSTTGEPLAFEIERWVHGGDSLIWINVPSIDGGSTTDSIWVYYGDPDASSAEDGPSVWNTGYVGVWHLHDDYDDSTANLHHGTNNGSTNTAGRIGDGQNFGGSQFIEVTETPALDISGPLTLEAWAYRRPGSSDQVVIGKTGYTGNQRSYALGFNLWSAPDGPSAEMTANGLTNPGTDIVEAPAFDVVQTWIHLAVVYDPAALKLYVNGVEAAVTSPAAASLFQNDVSLMIGAAEDGTVDPYDGILDEPRISNVARSADWIAAGYLAMTDSFITYGAKQTL